MKRTILGFLVPLLLAATLPAVASGKRILLIARDVNGQPVQGLRFTYELVKSRPTNKAGATELDLPADHQPGQQIKVLLVPSARTQDWFLVNPQVNIPGGTDAATVVLMRRTIFRQLAAEARDTPRPPARDEPGLAAEDQRRALVEAAARRGLTETQLETAIRSFAETQNPNDQGIAAYLGGRYSQAEELLQGAADKKEKDLIETQRYLGAARYGQAKYREAASTFRKAIALLGKGDDADLLSWLGESLRELAEWTEAESLLRQSLSLDERNLGPEHPHVATRLNNLAQLLHATNRFTEAEALLRRALRIDEKRLGPDHPDVGRDLNNLGALLQDIDRLAEAEPLKRRALAIDKKRLGDEHPYVANDLNNLALLLKATNRLAEAEPLMREALAIHKKSFGPDHSTVANDLNNLAQVLQDTNRLAEAEPLMRQVLAINERSFGPDHPQVAISLSNLALLLRDSNRLAEAEPLARRALAIDEKSLGPDHTRVATRLNNLARLLNATDRFAEAEPLVQRGLAIAEKSLGADHPLVATLLNNQAELFQATSRLGEAEPLLLRALAIDEKSLGPDHPQVARDLGSLAALYQVTQRAAAAEPLRRRALEIYLGLCRRTGFEHTKQAKALEDYRELLQELGKSDADIAAAVETLRSSSE